MTDTATTSNAVNREAIRAELEARKAAYKTLLTSLSEEDWKAKSANPAWKVGQLMWHLGRGMEFFSQAVEFCRRGKAPNPPVWLVNPDEWQKSVTAYGTHFTIESTFGSVGEHFEEHEADILNGLGRA